MVETFFDPPPRPRGRGWWRRLGRCGRSLLLPAGIAAVLLGLAAKEFGERARLRRLVATGERSECEVIRKSERSSAYFVTLLPLDSGRTIEVEVAEADYQRASVGMRTPYYGDHHRRRGVAELERSHREDVTKGVLLTVAGGCVCCVILWILWSARRDLRTLVAGVERVARHEKDHYVLLLGGLAAPFRLDERQLYVRTGDSGKDIVVLVSGDERCVYIPSLGDLPRQRLDLECRPRGQPRLPEPPRRMSAAWRNWARSQVWAHAVAVIVLACTSFGLVALVGWSSGVSTAWWCAAGGTAALVIILSLAILRTYFRLLYLWTHGAELHALCLEQEQSGRMGGLGGTALTLAYRWRDRTHERRFVFPDGVDKPLVVPAGEGAAASQRVVVLIDADQPARWALVTEACAQAANLPRAGQ